ncbi:acid phosphatase [Coccidioides immitis RS]|uniref:Acid phosphatase n=3 Tax=Coccidioides immitis TaxID=5501 RepID=J3KAH4_COCIM|nr:acid phosphatase [Coccidioides immitis RS]EAS32022.3 acid phosphatase [Coccidioides immitis RS]KMP07210.1 hypothetical protein CIRG_06891 [Coccidioides immitis RMSCC 2394]
MTTLLPRGAYSKEELEKLYPKGLELQLVQVFLRHGERTPVSARFQNTGLYPYWPYCNLAKRFVAIAAAGTSLTEWDEFHWRRKIEKFGNNDQALLSVGPAGEPDGICQLGELTDKGRQTTLALGRRLRYLYVEQLGYMPKIISNADHMYLRATPVPRALESLQQTFWGMYPASARTSDFENPTIVQRTPAEETLYPNEGNCHRFRQLARLFAQRAAERWNESEQMDYLNSIWSKWMPPSSPRVAVDSRPRLSGILDTINSTMAHGPETRLPSEFYDTKGYGIADQIATDEWFAGYKESKEYRKLGIGALMGDIVDRMVAASVSGGWWPTTDTKREHGPPVKFAISGCHDTTIAAILTSLGAFDNGKWPPYTSNIAIELFKDVDGHHHKAHVGDILEELSNPLPGNNSNNNDSKPSSLLSFFRRSATTSSTALTEPSDVARTPVSKLPPLHKHYVRIRYNDQPVAIPGCAAKPANHLPGEPTFCTLEAFKQIVDKFTPGNWREECGWNTDKGMFAEGEDRAGY